MSLPDSVIKISKESAQQAPSSLTVRSKSTKPGNLTQVKYINYVVVTIPGEITL
jgi:hypothetical protein